MKFTIQAWMSLGVMTATAYTVFMALKWPFQTALFPLALGIVVFLMATAVFVLEQLGNRKEDHANGASPVDFQLSTTEDQAVADRRTLEIFFWILGFVFLILLVGFPLSIPVYFISFLRFKCRETWKLTIVLAGLAWAFFYGLFVSVLNTFFMEGWLQKGLRFMGILS